VKSVAFLMLKELPFGRCASDYLRHTECNRQVGRPAGHARPGSKSIRKSIKNLNHELHEIYKNIILDFRVVRLFRG
jgi:hypothetical protein